jgi:protein ImuB
MKRVMCIYFPAWPLQRLIHDRPELRGEAVVLARSDSRGQRVVYCSQRAAQIGVRPGMPLAEALAVAPALHVEEEDGERDRQAMEQLAVWAERYSPIVGLEENRSPGSLLLDITGCADCFRGEGRLHKLAARELRDRGYVARVGMGDTIGIAWALAHYLNGETQRRSGETERQRDRETERQRDEVTSHHPFSHLSVSPSLCLSVSLSLLSVAALRLPPEILDLLLRLRIDYIDELEALPRSSLPARFGPQLLERLDQFFGRTPELIAPHRVLPDIRAAQGFAYPVEGCLVLQPVIERLAEKIHVALQKRNQGARVVECWLYHEAVSPERIEIGLSRPSRSHNYLGKLLRIKLEQTHLSAPVSGISLRVLTAEPLSDDQGELFDDGSGQHEEALAELIDRLGNRLGREAIAVATLVPDPQPEFAYRFEPCAERRIRRRDRETERRRDRRRISPSLRLSVSLSPRSRPLRLLRPTPIDVLSLVPDGPPIRFSWKGTDYRILCCWGPERIETGWWRGNDVHRDYYVVATQLGNRFWIFRRHDDGRWFLHGSFD